jgi:hypothetical protein
VTTPVRGADGSHTLGVMDFVYPAFGTIVIDGEAYDHDVTIDSGEVAMRDKGPSRPLKGRQGHTPLSAEELIPWSQPRLIVGSGYSGRLPVLPEVKSEAERRGVDLVVMPTADAVDLLNETDQSEVNAILHVTC